jgi:hypothetical protein
MMIGRGKVELLETDYFTGTIPHQDNLAPRLLRSMLLAGISKPDGLANGGLWRRSDRDQVSDREREGKHICLRSG